jgi:hypothetical protein
MVGRCGFHFTANVEDRMSAAFATVRQCKNYEAVLVGSPYASAHGGGGNDADRGARVASQPCDEAEAEAAKIVAAFKQRRSRASQPPRTEEEKFAAKVARDFIARQTGSETVGTSGAALPAFGNSGAAAAVTKIRADDHDGRSLPVSNGTLPLPRNAEERFADNLMAAFLKNGARK